MGHISEPYLRVLLPFLPKYLHLNFCRHCAVSKITKAPYTNKAKQAQADIDKTNYDETNETKQASERVRLTRPTDQLKVISILKMLRTTVNINPVNLSLSI